MTTAAPVPPLVVEFGVAADIGHAFDTWVSRADLWWPPSHTVSGRPATIVFEPRVGGHIVERDERGGRHVWGEITHWEPPVRIHFLWHLFFTPQEATRVELTFTPSSDGTTVRLVQTGWDALGDEGPPRREGNLGGWSAVTTAFQRAADNTTTTEEHP